MDFIEKTFTNNNSLQYQYKIIPSSVNSSGLKWFLERSANSRRLNNSILSPPMLELAFYLFFVYMAKKGNA